ncbi:MAG: alpha/beta hydrolase [Flavobacteriales bacterium]|nr:MAG: alpha/beta hydrolase [Flavobacteriales bacterium]
MALVLILGCRAQQTPTGVLPGAECWYLPAPDGVCELFVMEFGTGSPVVVLHGGPGADLTYMLPIANGLDSTHRFVFYDQRGSLRSPCPTDSISMRKHVLDLEALRMALGLEKLDLVSHSAGTLLAYEYLAAFPKRVGAFVLVGGLPHKNGWAYFDKEYSTLWEGLQDSASAFENRPAVASVLDSLSRIGSANRAKRATQLALIRQVGAESVRVDKWVEAMPMRVNAAASDATRKTTNFDYDYSALLANHSAQVVVINGDLDFVVGPRGSPLWKSLSATASNVIVNVIPDAGHIVWRDRPELFRRCLRTALARKN